MVPEDVTHGIPLSQVKTTGRKSRRSVGSKKAALFFQSFTPWLSSTSSWRLNLSSSSHEGERNGLGNRSSTTTDQNKTQASASLAKEPRVPWCLPTAQQIPQKCGHNNPHAHNHPLHNRHTAMSASSSWIFICLINTQVGKHSILQETPVTWREWKLKTERKGEEEMGHMVTAKEGKGKKKSKRQRLCFFAFKLFWISGEEGRKNVLYCSGSWYPPVAFPYEAR